MFIQKQNPYLLCGTLGSGSMQVDIKSIQNIQRGLRMAYHLQMVYDLAEVKLLSASTNRRQPDIPPGWGALHYMVTKQQNIDVRACLAWFQRWPLYNYTPNNIQLAGLWIMLCHAQTLLKNPQCIKVMSEFLAIIQNMQDTIMPCINPHEDLPKIACCVGCCVTEEELYNVSNLYSPHTPTRYDFDPDLTTESYEYTKDDMLYSDVVF